MMVRNGGSGDGCGIRGGSDGYDESNGRLQRGDSDRGGDDWLMAVNDGGDCDDGNDGDGDSFYDNFQGNDIKILFND